MMNNLIKVGAQTLIGLLIFSSSLALSEELAAIDLVFNRIYEKNPEATFPNQDVSCEVTITAPVDSRFNKDNLGVNHLDEPVVSNQAVTGWLQSSLMGMDSIGIKTTTESKESNIVVSTKLNRMYVWSHGLRLYATMSLEATFKQPKDGVEVIKNYRINGTKLNWAGLDSEFATTINIGVNRLIEQISIDLASQCNKGS